MVSGFWVISTLITECSEEKQVEEIIINGEGLAEE